METRRVVASPEQEVHQQKAPLMMRGDESNSDEFTYTSQEPIYFLSHFVSYFPSHFKFSLLYFGSYQAQTTLSALKLKKQQLVIGLYIVHFGWQRLFQFTVLKYLDF